MMFTAEDAGDAFGKGLLPLAYLAGMYLEAIGQFGYRLFSLQRFQGYPDLE